jgi:hypothetical protein
VQHLSFQRFQSISEPFTTQASHRSGQDVDKPIGRHGCENQKFPLPPEIDEILDRLPPQVTLNVPSDVLVHWFSPASADGDMDEVTLARAENYARSCGCRFAYHASIREGVFYRLVKPPQ